MDAHNLERDIEPFLVAYHVMTLATTGEDGVAHAASLMCRDAGQRRRTGAIVPVLSNPFGWNWNLFGTAGVTPGPLLPLGTIWVLMVGSILVGQVWSVVISQRIALHVFPDRRTATRGQLPLLAGMVAYSILSLWIVAQPMTMRTTL